MNRSLEGSSSDAEGDAMRLVCIDGLAAFSSFPSEYGIPDNPILTIQSLLSVLSSSNR